jgi:hypothetical protein
MGAMANGGHTWGCPACGRRVPRRVGTCHCGMTRERAEELAAAQAEAVRDEAPRASRRPLRRRPRGPRAAVPGDVKALLAGMVLVLLAGLGWLAFGPRPEPIRPVLGIVDPGPPPAPRPTPRPTPAFKLPWWK